MSSLVPTTTLAGLNIVALTRAEIADLLLRDFLIQSRATTPRRAKLVFSVNGQGIALTRTEPGYLALMREAEYLHADGQSVVTASRVITATPIPQRSATTDLFHDCAKIAEAHGLSFFILGAKSETNAKAVAAMRKLYPTLRIVGAHHGYEADPERYVALIEAAKPDVVWLAFGKPRQEHLARWLRDRVLGPTWIKPCGGLYEFLADETGELRAPAIIQRYGLEWLYRTYRDPRRLLWRYVTTNLITLWVFLLDGLATRCGRLSRRRNAEQEQPR